jgi:GTP-binding protein HflX
VGFIRKLPHGLIESFKSTLDEIRESDLILHIVDISHPDFEEQIDVVNQTLAEIGADNKKMLTVFNKTDAFTFVEKDPFDLTPIEKENISLDELKNTWIAKANIQSIFISAKNKDNIEELKNEIYQLAKKIHQEVYPYNNFLY